MPFTWLYDTVNNIWHIWHSTNPNNGDTAFCGHTKTNADTPWDVASHVPVKCSTCVTDGVAAGMPPTG